MTLPNPPTAVPNVWPGAGASTSAFSDDALSHRRLQAAIAAGATAAFHTDLVTRERWWSPEMFSVHGISRSELVPSDYMGLVYPDDRGLVEAAFQQSFTSGSHQVQYRVQWPDGSIHWLEGASRA